MSQTTPSIEQDNILTFKMPLVMGSLNLGEAIVNLTRYPDKINVLITSTFFKHALDIPKDKAINFIDKCKDWINK